MSHSCQLPTADTIFMEHSITAVDNHNNEFNSGPVTPFSLTEMTHHDSHWNHHQDCKIPRIIPSLDSIEENFQQQQKEEILTMSIPTFSLLHHAESRYFHPRKQHNNSLLHESLILSIVFEFYFGTLKQRQELATCRRGERLGSILTTDSTQASSNDTMSFLLLHEMLSLRLVCKSWKYFLEKESKIIHRVAIPLIHERIRQRYDIKPMPSQQQLLLSKRVLMEEKSSQQDTPLSVQ
ncbi:hypothetical protein C9374_002017 [Naegleria lovaniensis]|uniref:F-box domain-containing protein n=1 Tax=Naegleria lovaniensis TaxID=51637 RepID=A0AA88KR30_NAELO|nr:uncharacterized protein C9374_002017 [Naegleria lovaniensis]KAG2386982.1 hypothetical protein C9374_002017 [Naegleria lovaniensis]